jgi:hypothetical protein
MCHHTWGIIPSFLLLSFLFLSISFLLVVLETKLRVSHLSHIPNPISLLYVKYKNTHT